MEIWDAYDENENLTGIDLIRGEAIPEGLFHLVCEIIVRHEDGDYLLMQRDYRKPNYGGWYEVTAGGSALRGEDSISCAKRELVEETGISEGTFKKIGSYVNHRNGTIYHNYLCLTQCDKKSITLQEGETISYKWLNENAFIDFVNSDEIIYSQKLRYESYFKEQGYLG